MASASSSHNGRPEKGNVAGHYSVVFKYPNGVSLTFGSTQFGNNPWEVGWRFFGTKGASEAHYSGPVAIDRKSTRLNSSHMSISYAVFCLKKKTGPQALHA